MKICFAASSGGHFEQLMMLKPLMEKYESFVVTEKTGYEVKTPVKCYYLQQVNRRQWRCLFYLLKNTVDSLRLLHKEQPDVVVCTGVLAMIPLCMEAKLSGRKLIYIESFAKVTSATLTGKLLYHYADRFYVQWTQMKEIYPDALRRLAKETPKAAKQLKSSGFPLEVDGLPALLIKSYITNINQYPII